MRRILAELVASGVELPAGFTWTDETVGTHLGMATKHLWRSCVIVATAASRLCRRRPTTPLAAHDAAGGGASSSSDTAGEPGVDPEIPTVDGVPEVDALAERGLIMPVGTWKEKWDLVILMLIVYSAIAVPVRVCFDEDATGFMWYFEVSMTFGFITDMYFTFNTVYFDSGTGQWITTRRQIALNYLKSWFWVDAPSSIPVELVDLICAGNSQQLGLLRFLRMFRLLRLLRLLKVDEYIDTLENALDVNLRILRVVFMLVKICFLSHILGCFWYYTAVLSNDEDTPTWTEAYDDGRIASPDVGTSVRYLYSVYWAVTTLTTVGYGDVTPQNDAERGYALAAMLCSALVFGYMISNIGSLVASMDRQAALVEEKTDSVKEYVAWRGLPRDLSLRVKKHYSFYFTRRAAFDEVELLEGLSPSLRSEVTRFVLKETLGKLPLFTQQLDPEFQMEVFPLIKPVSYGKGETVFQRGEPSRDLIFLLKGEVKVISALDGVATSLLTPTQEIVLAKPDGKSRHQEPVMHLEHTGCFGESVLTGRRRQATHVAAAWCETLVLTKDDLVTLFEKNPRAGKRIVKTLLAEVDRKEKLQLLLMRFIIGSLAKTSPVRNALIIQKAWSRYATRVAASNTNTAAARFADKPEPCSPGGALSGIVNEAVQMGRAHTSHQGLTPEQVRAAAPPLVGGLFFTAVYAPLGGMECSRLLACACLASQLLAATEERVQALFYSLRVDLQSAATRT